MRSSVSLGRITKSVLAGLSLVLAVLLIPLTAIAMPWGIQTYTPEPGAQALVSSLGCTATVMSTDSSRFNARYEPMSNQIRLIGFDNIPPEWRTLILLHETGHCIQWQNGEMEKLDSRGPYEIEWDADAFAIKKYSELTGKDGAALNAEIWATIYQQYGYEGDADDEHGLLTGSITRGLLNRTTPHT